MPPVDQPIAEGPVPLIIPTKLSLERNVSYLTALLANLRNQLRFQGASIAYRI
jgi:hypothetical protein